MDNKKLLLENLKLLDEFINNSDNEMKLKDSSGFCHLIWHNMHIFNYGILTNFFHEQAETTYFVTREEIEDYNEKCNNDYSKDSEVWLFLPDDWESRKKWLKEYIKQNY